MQGWTIASVMFVPLALLATTLLPLLDRGRVMLPFGAALVAIIAGLIWAHWAPLYSPQQPQHVNFIYTVDADTNRATYSVSSPNPLPRAILDAMPFTSTTAPLPWEHAELPVAPAEVVARPSAVIETLPTSGKTRSYLLRPGASTNLLGLVIDKKQPIEAIRMAGHTLSLDPRRSDDFRWALAVAPPPEGIRIEIDTDSKRRSMRTCSTARSDCRPRVRFSSTPAGISRPPCTVATRGRYSNA